MPTGFTKEPIPYVSNKTYLLRFLFGFLLGFFAGFLAGNPILGIGIGVGIGTIFALRPSNKDRVQITILSLCIGAGSGIGRLLDFWILGFITGSAAGFLIHYFWKQHISKLEEAQ